MSGLTRIAQLHVRIEAHLRCAHAVVAAERFRLQSGRLPVSLDELVPGLLPAIPIDPFDGQALRFAETDEGICVYSVGEDRRDDGGDVARTTDHRHRPADVGVRLHALPHRGVEIIGPTTRK